MRRSTFEFPEALVHEAQAVATAEQTSFEEFVPTAMMEKSAATRTTQYFRTRTARADPQAFLAGRERITQVAGPVVEGEAIERGSVGRPAHTEEEYGALEQRTQHLGISREELVQRRIGAAIAQAHVTSDSPCELLGFGMWADRPEMHDAATWVAAIRERERTP